MAEYKQYITQNQENGSVLISEDARCLVAGERNTVMTPIKAAAALFAGSFHSRFRKSASAK